jgi:biopolymer transport protein ExbD
MAIHTPGIKFRHSRLLSKAGGKRNVVAILSLTAMVDMFTVLVIFLLPNYGEVLFIPKEVILPQAEKIKELKPATIITISEKEVYVNGDVAITYDELRASEQWLNEPLKLRVEAALQEAKVKYEESLKKRLQDVIQAARGENEETPEVKEPWRKITVQADKGMDFLAVKKVLLTVSEAGAGEINFAVVKRSNTVSQ